MAKTDRKASDIVAGPIRLSYAWVWEAREPEKEGDKPKYSSAFLVPEASTTLVKKINKAIEAAIEEGKSKFGVEWATKNKSSFRNPLREGNEEKPGDDVYEDMLYFNASSTVAPKIVDQQVQPILDQDEVYSGCWVNAALVFYPYNNEGRGVGVRLGNIQKVRDDEKLAGGRSAEEDFAPMNNDEDDI